MFIEGSFSNQSTFFQKIKSFDYILFLLILVVGVLSGFAMYSSDGGELAYHTKSHLVRFSVFYVMMIFISFINIKTWLHRWLFVLYCCPRAFVLGIFFWSYSIWLSKVDKFILYQFTTFRTYENRDYCLLCEILSPHATIQCK